MNKMTSQKRTKETKVLPSLSSFPSVKCFFVLSFSLFALHCNAQIQQAWVAHYNNNLPAGNHQALKLALDSLGSPIICGFSQNTNGGTGYAVVKYAPNGAQPWCSRLDTTNSIQNKPTAFAINSSNNIVVTGNAGTVEYDSNGIQLWTTSYNALDISLDASNNVFLCGFGTNFEVAKLSAIGSNAWSRTYTDLGSTVSQALTRDASGDVYVAGSDVFYSDRTGNYQQLLIVKFDGEGNRLWVETDAYGSMFASVQVSGMQVGGDGGICVLHNLVGIDTLPYTLCKRSADGTFLWVAFNPINRSSAATGVAVARSGAICVTGMQIYGPLYWHSSSFGTYGLGSTGAYTWTNNYPSAMPSTLSAGLGVVSDASDHFYVTGYSDSGAGHYDIVTIAYDTNGKQLWLQRYDGAAHLDDVGNAIAVDNNGNVYVAGYETVAGGGTEMVLIKYAPVTVQKQTGGVLLQAQGSPNEPFDIRATTNLTSWSDLATTNADANGLLQYLDTNAQLYPWRFYLAIPQ